MERAFLLSAMLIAGGAVITAFAQNATTTNSTSQSASSVPDFSGPWVYPFCCGFGPALSGAGPVVNKSRTPQRAEDGQILPNVLVRNVGQFAGDYSNPILKPHAAEIVRKHGEIEASGLPYPTPRNQCWPEGVPFVLANMGMQMIQQPDRVTILYEHDHQVRRVRMNEAHPAHVKPSWYGDSVGQYEGDTLLIDTVGIKIGSFSIIDWYGTPYTEALHVVERYRFIEYEAAKEAEERNANENRRMPGGSGATSLTTAPDYRGKALQLQFTVEDEGVFTMPWSATITYRRSFGEWPEHVCAESRRATYIFKESAIPRADKRISEVERGT
jgi:hypothetical protein